MNCSVVLGKQNGRNAYILYGTLLKADKIIKSRGVYVAFYSYMRVEMQPNAMLALRLRVTSVSGTVTF